MRFLPMPEIDDSLESTVYVDAFLELTYNMIKDGYLLQENAYCGVKYYSNSEPSKDKK